jgi:hypothetical protein
MNTLTRHDVTIRTAGAQDALALGRLAQLDGRLYGGAAALVAEVEGELIAALPLDGSPAIADPFRRTAQLVAMLELRRGQIDTALELSGPRVSRALRAVRRRRRYRAPASA